MLSSLFSQVFACCIRNRPRKSTILDENSHLIPATAEDGDVQPNHVPVIDHQKMKERLDMIVRSKEGKMVNVNAHIPFNLYNRTLSDPSSSRSASRHGPLSNRTNHNHSHPNNQLTQPHLPGRHATPTTNSTSSSNRRHSPSPRSRYTTSRNNSASRSSLRYRNYPSPDRNDVDAPSGSRYPILNVRLVKGAGPSAKWAQYRRRGRKTARFGESEAESEAETEEGSPEKDGSKTEDEDPVLQPPIDPKLDPNPDPDK